MVGRLKCFLSVLLYYVIVKQIRKLKKCHTVRTVLTSNRKIVKRGQIDNTEIYDRSLSLVDTVTLFKSDQVKLLLRLKISPLNEMMRSYKSFLHVSKAPTLAYNGANSVITKRAIILNIIHDIYNFRETYVVVSTILVNLKRADGFNHYLNTRVYTRSV